MKQIITGLLLFVITAIGIAQKPQAKETRAMYRVRMKKLAREEINDLKEGVLLVRLQTRKNTIEALRNSGNWKQADAIEKKQAVYNRKIIRAFKTNFTFCPAYFFYSDHSVNVMDKQFEKVVFLNDSLKANTLIKVENKKFLTAEFGNIEQDTTKYHSQNSNETGSNWSLNQALNYDAGTNMRFGALIIKSDKLIQLKLPFPYYVRTFDTLPIIKRRLEKVVVMMNEKLDNFYIYINKQ